MTKLLPDDGKGEGLAKPARASRAEPRGRGLLTDLVSELAISSSSGVSFIATCLDRVIETWDLRAARAVVIDAVLGVQIFNAGRRPFELNEKPSALVAMRSGIYTEPSMVEGADELDAVARLCEIALRLDRLRHDSLRDPLTGLYNRRGFDEHLRAALSRSVRYGWSFGLVVLDLNGFKAINDSFGHQYGDAVLRQVGEQFRQGMRSGDIAARVGGDEFALLLPLKEPASLDGILERFHGADGFHGAGHVGWTAGLAMCPDDASTVGDLYRIADERLYEVKVLDAACPSEMMAMPKAIAITNGAARAKNKTVKAAAAAAMALALSGGIAAAATGNLPGQSEARHRRVSDHIEPSATTGNLPGQSDSRHMHMSTSEPESIEPSAPEQSAATADSPSTADASSTALQRDQANGVAGPPHTAATNRSDQGPDVSALARGNHNPQHAASSAELVTSAAASANASLTNSPSTETSSDSSESASDGQAPANHGADVSNAAQTCPTGPHGQHGKCVSAIAHTHS